MTDTVIWDFNGTLFDDLDVNLAVLNKMLTRRGIPPASKDRYLDIFDFPLKDAYRRFGFDFADETYENAANEYIELYSERADTVGLTDGAEDVLKYFAETRRRQVIVSASPLGMLENQLNRLKIREYFDDVRGMNDHYAYGKTEAAAAWMNTSGADPSRTVFIGDTTHDCLTAEAIGVGCVLTATGHNSLRRLLNTGAAVAETLRDAVTIIDG